MPGADPVRGHFLAVDNTNGWSLPVSFCFWEVRLQQAGLVYTTAGNAGFITSLYVVLVPILLFFFWRERFHWIAILAMGMAVAGAFLAFNGRPV